MNHMQTRMNTGMLKDRRLKDDGLSMVGVKLYLNKYSNTNRLQAVGRPNLHQILIKPPDLNRVP